MSGNTNKTIKMGTADMNPYDILGISYDASDTIINKAYRQLARKYHPDKQKQQEQKQSKNKLDDDMKHKFHLIQLAKSFLLDDEHKKERIQYDKQLKSNAARKVHEDIYNKNLSMKRKQMKEELMKQEELAAKKSKQSKYSSTTTPHHYHDGGKNNTTTSNTTTTSSPSRPKSKKSFDPALDKLSKDGERLREQYINEQMKKHYEQAKIDVKEKEKYQIRLKWSRKRMSTTILSENTLSTMLSSLFGNVESVEMIGSKGNAALITFVNVDNCHKAVKYYKKSNEMRATYINDELNTTATNTINHHDPDWKMNRELERERILRHMEQNDHNDDYHDYEIKKEKNKNHHKSSKHDSKHNKNDTTTIPSTKQQVSSQRPFPPMLPMNTSTNSMNPLQLLEEQEDILLLNTFSTKILQEMKLHTTE